MVNKIEELTKAKPTKEFLQEKVEKARREEDSKKMTTRRSTPYFASPPKPTEQFLREKVKAQDKAQEQQQKAREQEQRERQERIQQGKITSQLQREQQSPIDITPKTESRIEKYRPVNTYASLSFGSALGGAFSNVGKYLKGEREDFFSSAETFKAYGRRKEDRPTSIPKFGTIQTSTKPRGLDNPIDYTIPQETSFVTFGELQEKTDQEKALSTLRIRKEFENKQKEEQRKAQAKIEKGEPYEEVVKEYLTKEEEINKEFQEKELKAREKISKKDIKGLKKTSGQELLEGGKAVLESTLYLTPPTSVGLGTYKASKSLRTSPIIIDDVKKGVPLYPDIKESRKDLLEQTLPIATAGLGTGAGMRAVERSILRGELKSLEKKPFEFVGVQNVKGSKSKIESVFRRSDLGLKQELRVGGDAFKEGKGSLLPKGEGTLTTTGKFDWNYLKGRDPTLYYEKAIIDVGDKSRSFKDPKESLNAFTELVNTYKNKKGFEGGKFPLKFLKEKPRGDITYDVSLNTAILKARSSFIFQGQKSESEIKSLVEKGFKMDGDIVKEVVVSKTKQLKPNLFYSETARGDKGFTIIKKSPKKSDVRFIGGRKTGGTGRTGGTPQALEQQQLTEQSIKGLPTSALKPKLNLRASPIERAKITMPSSRGRTSAVMEQPKVELTSKNILIPKTRPSQLPKTRQAPMVKPISATTSSFNQLTKQTQPQTQPQSQPQLSRLNVLQAQPLKQKSLLGLTQQPLQTTPTTPRLNLGFGFGGGFGFPPFMPFKPQLKGRAKRKTQLTSQPTAYQVSFTGAITKKKGKSKLLGKSLGYNPFEIRGL